MATRVPVPELACMVPENYKKYFRKLCWSGTRKSEKKTLKKIGKKEKLPRLKAANAVAVCYAPALLGNPSNFAVYATVRRSVLTHCKCLHGLVSDFSDDSDNDDLSSQLPMAKLPKITGIGLRAVFSLISQARVTDTHFCEHALEALLDILQGHAPEELAQEPTEIILNLHAMLVEVASGNVPPSHAHSPTALTALSSSCLIALSVARGELELLLNTVTSLIMSVPSLSKQYLQVPANLTTLQRSVLSIILGSSSRNQWLNHGVPHRSLVTSFPVDLPPQLTTGAGELVVRALVSDGCFLYVFTSKGLLKIGSGYGSSIKQHVYLYKPDFFASDRHGWLGYCKNKLYVRIGRKKTEVYEIDKDTFEVKNVIRLEPGQPAPIEQKSAVFTDGNQLGLILLTNFDSLTIRMYDVSTSERVGTTPTVLVSHKELNVHLLRRRTLAFGRAPFEDGLSRRTVELDAPVAMQLNDDDEDPLLGISTGQDFGLLSTDSGKVYFTGKSTSLGYKAASSHVGHWTLMKETLLSRNNAPNVKKCKVIQVAVGHEGVHAILVLDNGTALFTGMARRGEDGNASKHRRTPKPTRPKKVFKADGHFIVYAACNYGSTALVTRQGLLLMFGKDTQQCDSTGLVTALRHEKVIQVALGKAHAVVLTSFGEVYTFGINNKGQCGREFGYTKEKSFSTRRQSGKEPPLCVTHTWTTDYCRVCPLCRECTGFSSACHCARLPNRIPGEKCGCGEGDSGCSSCGVCRHCADSYKGVCAERPPAKCDNDGDGSARSDLKSEKDNTRYGHYEGHTTGVEAERDASLKVSCLPPARVTVPGGHRVVAVACGLHHSVLLTEHGEVLTFGSNQYGQLGAGDVSAHHRVVRVRVPRAAAVAAGSNHSAVLTRDGELYTFGSYQKGSLGRPRTEESTRADRSPVWHATPGRVPRLGPRHACKAAWVSASSDQTFVQVSQALINTDTLFSSTITANHNTIVILPNRPEHTFKCITINKNDGSCNAWTGPEQVDLVNTLACLDPLYDVLWCYQPQMRVVRCYNILAFDSHRAHRYCSNDSEFYLNNAEIEYPNHGVMKRLEDFKNLENYEVLCCNDERPVDDVALSNISVLNQELAIPSALASSVTRIHAALHLLGCLDSLTYAHDTKPCVVECKRDSESLVAPAKDDFQTVNRFESHGGGWGYSGHSVEAIRFMCDTDILLGGFGLFGGRGDYTARIKLFDIGMDGGEQEGDGELFAESEEVVFECAPRDRFPVLFDTPLPLLANRWYVAWACINGPSSDCGSSGQAMVINDEIGFHFKTSKKSNNGTDVNAGQIPCLLYNTMSLDHMMPTRSFDSGNPAISLSKNISRKVTVACFHSLITLLQWSWKSFKEIVLDTNGQIPINYQKLTVMKHQKRLVYVIQACLRLIKSYINEIYPQNNRKRNSHEYMSYFDAIADVRNLIQVIVADQTPSCAMLPRKPGKTRSHRVCLVKFALEMANSILEEAHETITACFHAFFPTPSLKWNHLCSLLFHVKDGVVPPTQIRELTSTCAALCALRSLRDVLQYIVPVTQSCITSNETKRLETKQADPKSAKKNHSKWHLLDVVSRLLDIVTMPIKQQMMTRQCAQTHDHGEIKQNERLSDFCCRLVARIIAELSQSATNIRQENLETNSVKHLSTPSRFMRVNQSRSWNTGNGSPDAICFTVDRPGVQLVGVGVFGDGGNYEYSIELLHDVSHSRVMGVESNPEHCWVSIAVAHGAFSAADCQHDTVQLKFDRPVSLKEDLRYAIRLCNNGGRTANGDCGLPSVKGPDGTTFRFASCSLSFNGTTLARGQLPYLIYYSTSKSTSNSSDSADTLMTALRGITLLVAGAVLDRGAELFSTLRNELTAEDLRRNAVVLQHSPLINILIPYTLANVEGLNDLKSVIQLLEMIHKMLPHVAAMNLLVPTSEEGPTTTTTHCYTWLESEHPYKQATVTNMRVLFPPNVSWVVIEMDPRSVTAQPEDSLTIYAVASEPKNRCHCSHDVRTSEAPLRKVYKRLVQLTSESGEVEELGDDSDADTPCVHYNCTYVSVAPKLANIASEWPQKALLLPGNEVIFSLETASDYLIEYNKTNNEDSRFGFRCLCVGYEDSPFTWQRQGLVALEMELVYAGSACASRLLAPDLDIPPLTFSTIEEVQVVDVMGTSPSRAEAEASQDGSEALLLSRGLELSSPPTIHHILDGQPLSRCISTERQFLSDFVSGAESTAGGRLAHWLAPTPRVEPAKCELRAPATPVRPAARVTLPILVRDQYGESVASPALKVKVLVQRLEDSSGRPRRAVAAAADGRRGSVPDVPYQPTVRDSMCFHAITMMKAYHNYSFEELRMGSSLWSESAETNSGWGAWGEAGGTRVPAERLPVCEQSDGSYTATWTPRAPGAYQLRCMLDELPAPQELTIQVIECTSESISERGTGGEMEQSPPAKLRRFAARFSAGLRVRASPSLQAEEIGCVPPGATIACIEELVNKDGTWVRLGAESLRSHVDGSGGAAWCLQHHRHLDRALLLPVDASTPPQSKYMDIWSGYRDAQGDMQSWTHEDDIDVGLNDINGVGKRTFPFSVQCDLANDSDTSTNPFVFGLELSKRGRILRNESVAIPSPRGIQRRSNGNSDEWWSPVKQRSSDNNRDINPIQETEIGTEPDEHSGRRLAQAGTQTSPESVAGVTVNTVHLYIGNANTEEHSSPKSLARERIVNRFRALKCSPSPPPRPARAAPAPPAPRKHALSPAQAQCLRAIFAALLWHEGIVHDAIACAAFLKFHPQLPKQGARILSRVTHDVNMSRPQRHSVEVINAGQYLKINSSTLETLTRSGMEASASRARRNDFKIAIREEDAQASAADTCNSSSPSVVNVLPPALRALVALWDALYDADQLSVATDKFQNESMERNENDNSRLLSTVIQERDWKSSPIYKTPYAVKCELCGGARVPPPLAAHMQHAHPGCRAASASGFDRAGLYRRADPPAPAVLCGQIAQAYQLRYIYCEKCRDKALKAVSLVKQLKTKTKSDAGFERRELASPEVDYEVMKENAMFLLDLAPLTNSESLSASPWHEASRRSPPTPSSSMWQPAPPFQCLPALGAAPKACATLDTAKFHSLGRPPPPVTAPLSGPYGGEAAPGAQWPRVHRSVSMGQTSSRGLAPATPLARPAHSADHDTLSGAGSSLLAQPSASLQRLVGCGEGGEEGGERGVSAFEPPRLDPHALMRTPVLCFVLASRDLHSYTQRMDAAVRINTVRQYAFEAFNWLLRSATQPTCVHDVMWWFCTAIDKYARIVPLAYALEDNKECGVAGAEAQRGGAATASACALCPGGRAAHGARAALHALLGSVSALAPALPPSSAASLQAVRCWAMHYSAYDRAFLYRSQVFSMISKILSHSEDAVSEEGVLGPIDDSFNSHLNKDKYVWSCVDVTEWCEVSVSSRQGMAGALTDGSTETFWESGDEDRNKAKWVQVALPAPAPAPAPPRPYLVCVHVDNTRDTVNKTLLVSFLYSGGSSELLHMQDMEVDPKTAAWLCYTLPMIGAGVCCTGMRVRCEMRGPEAAVRVRQLRVLSAPAPAPTAPAAPSSPAAVLHALSEADTLRVFRLLTSQIFGKLLEWESIGSEAGGEAPAAEEAGAGDSDLREHVVGILFARHKLTSLQRQVMSHIVCAIGCEAARARDDWETALLCADADAAPPHQDNYCFEMLSLLLALSGSAVGCAHLAQRTELLADLLALLHTGSERVQRQVISLLRRIIIEIPPQKMLAAVNYGNDSMTRVTLMEHLMCYLGKGITVQVKVKGASAGAGGPATLGASVARAPPAGWFMRGRTTNKHAHLVAKLLTDMSEDKLSVAWGRESRAAMAQYVAALAQAPESERRPARCMAAPAVWMALAVLCVCDQAHIDLMNSSGSSRKARARESGAEAGAEARALCANHDDGATAAVIECRTCGALCAECDRFLHLNRAARTHHREICKEEESAIRIDIHEGCGRAKLFWLLLLVDRRTLKALAEFRGMEGGVYEHAAEVAPGAAPALSGVCRFCGARGNVGLLAIGNVCADYQCQEHGHAACARVLRCGHACGGVRGERACLPCLFGCDAGADAADAAPLRQDADDMCMICFTDPLQAAPAIQLKCGHVFHLHCCKKVLANKWIGPRITFSFAMCPICKENMCHWTLEELLAPIRRLREEVRRKALMRLEYEGLAPAGAAAGAGGAGDTAAYAMERYAYYVCYQCGKAYFGGLARCEAETGGRWEPAELVCGACSDVAGARVCPKHGADFLEYKCRYCCSVAVFFCFGTSHFCNACHDDFQRVTNIPKHQLPQCPAGSKGEQLAGGAEECPLHVPHPPTGEEFALGCGVCRHAHAF